MELPISDNTAKAAPRYIPYAALTYEQAEVRAIEEVAKRRARPYLFSLHHFSSDTLRHIIGSRWPVGCSMYKHLVQLLQELQTEFARETALNPWVQIYVASEIRRWDITKKVFLRSEEQRQYWSVRFNREMAEKFYKVAYPLTLGATC